MTRAGEESRAKAAPALARRRRRLERLASRADVAGRRLAALRLVAAVASVVLLAFTPRFAGAARALELGAALAALGFVVAVLAHRRPRRVRELVGDLLAVLEREDARLARRWSDIPHDGAGLAADPELAGDLSLVGHASLFQVVSRCATSEGRATLASWLTVGVGSPEIAGRQEAVQELESRVAFRHRLEAAGERGCAREAATRRLSALLSEPTPSLHDERPWLAPASLAWCVLTWLQAVPSALGQTTAFVPCLVVQALAFVACARRLGTEYQPLLAHEDTLGAWSRAFGLVERTRLRARAWRELRAELRGAAAGHDAASRAIPRLRRTLASLQLRHGLLHPIVNVLAPWDFVFTARLARWRREHAARIDAWLRALGAAEALSSLAGHARSLPVRAWPRVVDDGAAWSGLGVRHPLLGPDVAVENDVVLEAPAPLWLVTGSNMSGKSTLLRAVGQCTALALAGGAVTCRALTLRSCRLVTSIRVSDALEDGVSLFHAEVRRLKRVLDAVESAKGAAGARHGQGGGGATGPPVLFLLDEILRGTNTRERLAASRAILRRLAAPESAGLVTTHDLDLVELVSRHRSMKNVHFREHVEGGRMSFDHRLRPGPVETTNALEVLRLEGIEIGPDDVEA